MQESSPAAPRARAKLLVTILIASLNNSALAAGRLVLPMIALGLGASTFLVGLMSALFTAIPMLLSVRFGRWVDRSGTLIPIAFSTMLILASSLIYLVHSSQYSLLVIAGFIGAGAVFSHVATTRAVGRLGDTSERARNFGFLVVSYSLFQFLGPIVAGASYEHLGATIALLTIGGFSILSLAAIALRFHYYEQDPVRSQIQSPKGGALELLRLKSLRKWIFASGIFATAQTIYPFIISLHAAHIGLSASKAGILLGAYAVGAMISRAGVSIVTRYLPPQVILTSALLLGAAIYAALPLVHDMDQLVALSTLLGLPLGLGAPIALALIYGAAPDGRTNESVGLSMAVTNFLQTAAPLTLGAIASGPGVAPMVWALTLAMVASATIGESKSKD